MEPNNIATKIANISIKQFNSLPKTGKPTANEWTILTCIVKQQNANVEVVSLGTGSKCIGKSKLCPKGAILNDSHAEIMCRRGFLNFLYDQLNIKSDIFIMNEQSKKFVLKSDIKFHLFTTHVPCGDAAIFPKTLEENYGEIIEPNNLEPIVKKRKLDIYRTGAKCLEYDIKQDARTEGRSYHVTGTVRTKPGRGDPTASVSCSDKIAKWCYLGIQGALLMQLLDKPIYLDMFIILKETPFDKEAFERALYGRLGDLLLTEPYGKNIMNVHVIDLHFNYTKTANKIACASSIVWYQSSKGRGLEVAVNGHKQGATKKNYQTEKGRLKICKLELFKTFMATIKELNWLLDTEQNIEDLTYKQAKYLSKTYQINWTKLKKKFGTWSRKDPQLLQFVAK